MLKLYRWPRTGVGPPLARSSVVARRQEGTARVIGRSEQGPNRNRHQDGGQDGPGDETSASHGSGIPAMMAKSPSLMPGPAPAK